jgi:signal peptidase I
MSYDPDYGFVTEKSLYFKRTKVNVGDTVYFKSDIEQSGTLVEITSDKQNWIIFVLENKNGFSGAYIGGQTRVAKRIKELWVFDKEGNTVYGDCTK